MRRRSFGESARNGARAWQAWLLTGAFLVAVMHLAPQQVGMLPYKGMFISLGCLGGYWMHVWLFGHVEDCALHLQVPFTYQRTAIMCCAMLALSNGL